MVQWSDAVWIAFFAAIPPSIIALTTLIAVLMKISNLSTLMDGKFSELLKVATTSSATQAKVETLEKIATKPTVVTDRRTNNSSEIK